MQCRIERNKYTYIDYLLYDMARVYRIGNNDGSEEVLRLKFDYNNDRQYIFDHLSGWSKTENGDKLVYPYIWHRA